MNDLKLIVLNFFSVCLGIVQPGWLQRMSNFSKNELKVGKLVDDHGIQWNNIQKKQNMNTNREIDNR